MNVRRWLVLLYCVVALTVVAVLLFALCGIVRPDLVFAFGGRLVPWLGAVALLFVLVLAFNGVLAMKQVPANEPAGMPWETEGRAESARISRGLASNVSSVQAAVVLVPFGIFAALAVVIGLMQSDGVNLFTTDPAGNVYIHTGDRLVVADPAGRILTDVDVKSKGVYGQHVSDMQADEKRDVYFADGNAGKVTVLDRSGVLLRTIRLPGLSTDDMRLFATAADGSVYVLAGTMIERVDGERQSELYRGDLTYPSGIAAAPGGDVVVSDSDDRRLVRISPTGRATTIDLRGLTDAAGILYPTDVRVAADGDIYTILRKRDEGAPPLFWRGKLLVRTSEGELKQVPLMLRRGSEADLLGFSLLPDGRFLFVPLGYDAIYIGNAQGQVAPWGPGQLGAKLAQMSRRDLLVSWGPTLSLTLGVAFALLAFGVMLHRSMPSADPMQGQAYAPPPLPRAM